MARRIFRNVVCTAVLAVLLTTALIVPSLYSAYESSMSRELRREAECISLALEMAEDSIAFLKKMNTGSRITLISPDGTVLFDSMANETRMENHAGRPEVIQALADGSGESIRASDTLSETTIYFARRTADGRVLRIANTRRSMLGTFMNVFPLICIMLMCVMLLSLWIARKAAKRIVAPINALNLDQPLDNDTYDELAPLLTRMHRQHTQILEHMQSLEHARAELSAIMENMREGMVLLDGSNTVLSMNESAGEIFAVPAAQAIGRNLLFVNRDADLHALVKSTLHGEGGSFAMNRSGRHFQVYVSPVLKDGAVHGSVLLVLDVTERFAAEESRQEFTANVSHELKTPLTSISGFAEIIRDGIAQPRDIRHFAGMICKESARLIALVNDILELSQLDEKQNIGQRESVALATMLRDLLNDFSMAAEKKNLTLSLAGDAAEIDGHPLLLREMFFNLIDNAVKYTSEGGKISVSAENRAGGVRCIVSDTGIGIPEKHHPHVFERFYRVDKSHSRATGGTGLGLAIVKHVARIHGAQITLESTPGCGTKIILDFPVEK